MRSSLKPEQPKRNRKLFQKKKRFIGPIDKESNQCAPNFNIFHNLVKTRFIPPIPRFRIAYIFFYFEKRLYIDSCGSAQASSTGSAELLPVKTFMPKQKAKPLYPLQA